MGAGADKVRVCDIKPKTALGTRHHNPTEVADDGEGVSRSVRNIPDNDGRA